MLHSIDYYTDKLHFDGVSFNQNQRNSKINYKKEKYR